jgi:hypothetical protein
MADKTTRFTINSRDIASNSTTNEDIVGSIQTPDISANTVPVSLAPTKDNIFLEVDLDKLGEHRQPDNTRFIYKPEEISAEDHQFSLIDKQAIPDQVGADGTVIYFLQENYKFDEVVSVDRFAIDYEKPFFDSFTTPEFIEKGLVKPTFDTTSSTEEDVKLIEPNKFEVLNTPERVEQVFYKALFDAIGVTDDVNGVLPDDDQTAVIQDRNFDTSGVEDFSYRHIFKGLIDTVNLVETFRAEDGTIKDDSTIVDIFIASLSKIADDDLTNATDTVAFSPTSSRLDTTTTNDILSTVITFLRSPVDTASAADSGRLNSQDYFSEEYVWEDYAGTNSYF